MRRGFVQAVVLGVGLAGFAAFAGADPKKDADGYVAEIHAEPSYKAGDKSSFTVHLAPKTGFHIDSQFPVRWKADDPAPAGVAYDKQVMKREDGTFTETDGSFKVEFTAAKAGKYTLGGTLSLSVCNDKTCVMEKVPLDVGIEVK
jgi:hypothetical protein